MLTKQQLAVLRSEPGSNRVAKAMALTGVTQVTVAKALGLTQPYPGFDRDRSGERNEDRDEQERTPLAATGTGFDDDGLILTNNHVVENATSIQIQFYGDDERYAARVLGRDRLTDSALLELVERPARKLPRPGSATPAGWRRATG